MELLVSIAVITIISGFVIGNQRQFGSGAALRNIVNNLSLTLRQAQVYGITVKQYNSEDIQYSINNFSAGYGVYFNTVQDSSSYIFFRDLDPSGAPTPNGLYANDMTCPTGDTSECVDKTTLSGGHTISDLCTVPSGGVEDCSTPTRIDISFVRPNVEAKIYRNGAGALQSAACAEVSSPDGAKNSVVVYASGQISVTKVACTDAL